MVKRGRVYTQKLLLAAFKFCDNTGGKIGLNYPPLRGKIILILVFCMQ